MGLSGAYGPMASEEERFKVLDAAYGKGCRFWDTADIYGDSEDLIGKWFKRTGKRDEIFLATKFIFLCKVPGDPLKGMDLNGTPEYVAQALETSLKRLGVEQIDLWYAHRPDPKVPIELTVQAMAEQVKAGKVKYLGLSGCSVNTLRRAHAIHPISAVQFEYAAFTLDVERVGIVDVCKELGIALVCYSPLGRGLLTGTTTSTDEMADKDIRKAIPWPRFQPENQPIVQKLVQSLGDIGAKHGVNAPQTALAWLLAQGDFVIPIPGTTKIARLEENLAAINIQLSQEEEKAVRKAAESFANIPSGIPAHAALQFVETPKLTE